MDTFITDSPEQTQQIASNLANKLAGQHQIIALSGELGAGKTTFVQGFAKGLRITDKVLSPSFLLMRQHHIPGSRQRLIHLDLYRLEKINNLEELGLVELFADPDALIIIEWPQKLGTLLPNTTLTVTIKQVSKTRRKITVI